MPQTIAKGGIMNRKLLILGVIVLVAILLGGSWWLAQRPLSGKIQTCQNIPLLTTSTKKLPAYAGNGQPRDMHKQLQKLVGDWKVEKQLYMIAGTSKKPIISKDITTHREWIAGTGNRFMIDVTEGTLGGQPYYRQGTLGYSIMDGRYEWNTIDALNTNMMTYKGVRCSDTTPDGEISMSGEFTDQGLLGDNDIGKTLKQRTVIKIESYNRHVFELYFTPPEEAERLVDRTVYTRQ
jgi:hypothetical protein